MNEWLGNTAEFTVKGNKQSQQYTVHQKSNMDWPGIDPRPWRWEAGV